MKIYAIVPIKHHSSRVPGKNYKLMDNKPLYHYILNTLERSRYIDKIYVNTDSIIIKEGIERLFPDIIIYDRPASLIGDDISTNSLIIDTINTLKLDADLYLQTHTTNPLLKLSTINNAIETFTNSVGYDSLFSVKTLYTRLYNKNGHDMNHNRFMLLPTQQLDPIYEENSCIYIFPKDTLIKYNSRIGGNPILYNMPDIESQDIDWPEDFILTEQLIKLNKKKILITCPPMINRIKEYANIFDEYNLTYHIPKFTQTLSEEELVNILPEYDGWIIGDDPVTERVIIAGKQGRLKGCVKWGVGTDNIDFTTCNKLNIPITNTPNMFGGEVADVAIGYLVGLARDLFMINEQVKDGVWYKSCGISLIDKKIAVIGFGDIGKNICKRLQGFDMKIYVSDPAYTQDQSLYGVIITDLNTCLEDADFIIVACALNEHTLHLLNYDNISLTKRGVRIINVSRGAVIDELSVIQLLEENHIYGVAFDVYEEEPVSPNSKLLKYPTNIFGTHNCSNTEEAVDRASIKAINIINDYLSE